MKHIDWSAVAFNAFAIGALMSGSSLVLIFLNMETVPQTKQKAIEHGCAYYHPKTGNFTWKDVGSKP